MPKKYTIYWYQEGPEFREAFLYNLRDADVHGGGRIPKAAVVSGAEGLVAAESEVFGWTGKVIPFRPSRQCEWQGFELPCMTLPADANAGAAATRLGVYNYAVAVITSAEAKAKADGLKVPCVKNSDGAWLVNVELTRFSGQDVRRRAKLI